MNQIRTAGARRRHQEKLCQAALARLQYRKVINSNPRLMVGTIDGLFCPLADDKRREEIAEEVSKEVNDMIRKTFDSSWLSSEFEKERLDEERSKQRSEIARLSALQFDWGEEPTLYEKWKEFRTSDKIMVILGAIGGASIGWIFANIVKSLF